MAKPVKQEKSICHYLWRGSVAVFYIGAVAGTSAATMLYTLSDLDDKHKLPESYKSLLLIGLPAVTALANAAACIGFQVMEIIGYGGHRGHRRSSANGGPSHWSRHVLAAVLEIINLVIWTIDCGADRYFYLMQVCELLGLELALIEVISVIGVDLFIKILFASLNEIFETSQLIRQKCGLHLYQNDSGEKVDETKPFFSPVLKLCSPCLSANILVGAAEHAALDDVIPLTLLLIELTLGKRIKKARLVYQVLYGMGVGAVTLAALVPFFVLARYFEGKHTEVNSVGLSNPERARRIEKEKVLGNHPKLQQWLRSILPFLGPFYGLSYGYTAYATAQVLLQKRGLPFVQLKAIGASMGLVVTLGAWAGCAYSEIHGAVEELKPDSKFDAESGDEESGDEWSDAESGSDSISEYGNSGYALWDERRPLRQGINYPLDNIEEDRNKRSYCVIS